MDTPTRRRLTVCLGLMSVALGFFVLFLDWREGDRIRPSALFPIVVGAIAIAAALRGGRAP